MNVGNNSERNDESDFSSCGGGVGQNSTTGERSILNGSSSPTFARTWTENEVVKITMTGIYSFIFLCGVSGNVLFCVVLLRNKVLHTATNFYLLSMSCSDLFVLLFGLPYDFYGLWSHEAFFGKSYSVFHSLLLEASTDASILTITVFTIERYIGICHPLKSQTMLNLGRVPKIVACVWGLSLTMAVPVIVFHPSLYEGEKSYDSGLANAFISLSFVGLFVLPISIITALYLTIIRELKKSEKISNNSSPEAGNTNRSSSKEMVARNKDVIRVLVGIVLSFFFCFSPFHCQRLMSVFGDEYEEGTFVVLRAFTHISGAFLYLSTCVNPVLYHVMSDRFRKAFRKTLCHCSRKREFRVNSVMKSRRTSNFRISRISSFQSSKTTKVVEISSATEINPINSVPVPTTSTNFQKCLKTFRTAKTSPSEASRGRKYSCDESVEINLQELREKITHEVVYLEPYA